MKGQLLLVSFKPTAFIWVIDAFKDVPGKGAYIYINNYINSEEKGLI